MSESLTLTSCIAKFLSWAEKHLAPGTVIDYRRHLLRFAAAVGDVDAQELRAHHLISWGKTWHNIVAVQRCFNWLVEVELLERSPFAKVRRPRPGRRKRIFTRNELVRLLRAASPAFRCFLIALRETIARPQEVRALRWSDIESADASFSIEQALLRGRAFFQIEDYKSRERRADPDEPRIIPITRRLGRLLVRLQRLANPGAAEVFRSERGRTWTKEATRLRLSRLRKKLGMSRDARGEQLVCYSVRHTQATAACSKGVRDRILADIMGHTNTRTTARYQHLQTDHLLIAMDVFTPKRLPKPPAC